mmetsp:Transcript_12432/g.43890  ORF Transcript_12432/g.43890 Transcript_12432/m.43890 type:complete len:304 (+) Transcript_12432:10-921(+)
MHVARPATLSAGARSSPRRLSKLLGVGRMPSGSQTEIALCIGGQCLQLVDPAHAHGVGRPGRHPRPRPARGSEGFEVAVVPRPSSVEMRNGFVLRPEHLAQREGQEILERPPCVEHGLGLPCVAKLSQPSQLSAGRHGPGPTTMQWAQRPAQPPPRGPQRAPFAGQHALRGPGPLEGLAHAEVEHIEVTCGGARSSTSGQLHCILDARSPGPGAEAELARAAAFAPSPLPSDRRRDDGVVLEYQGEAVAIKSSGHQRPGVAHRTACGAGPVGIHDVAFNATIASHAVDKSIRTLLVILINRFS